MGRPLFHDRHAQKATFCNAIAALVTLGSVAGLTVLFFQRPRTVEAHAAMIVPPPPIDGERAYGYLKQICAIGPRAAGSPANARQRALVAEHFKKNGGTLHEQKFQTRDPQTGEPLELVNLIASWNPERFQRVVIGAHYDTRPHPDQEVPERRNLPFIGANDGASGVALLMEIANHLTELKTDWGIDLVLFDGEELVYGNNPRVGEYFLGSIEFARVYHEQRTRRRSGIRHTYAFGIVLDMVGGRNLTIKQEPNSLQSAPDLVRVIWAVARSLRVSSFWNQEGREVLDDHLALNRVGIPTVDIIDFDYPFWHKADDLPENCSPQSLSDVGRVVTAWLSLPRNTTRR
jgi:hypothetical protein